MMQSEKQQHRNTQHNETDNENFIVKTIKKVKKETEHTRYMSEIKERRFARIER